MEIENIEIRTPPIDAKLKIGLALLAAKTYFSSSAIFPISNTVDSLLSAGASVLFALVILESWYSFKTLIIYGVVLLLGFYSSMQIGNITLFITIITCLAIRREKFNEVLQWIYQCELMLFILHIVTSLIMSLFGFYSLYTWIEGVKRYCFGFVHPNSFSMLLFNLILMWVYLHFDEIKWRHIYQIIAMSTLSFFFTKTRTAYATSIAFCVLIIIVRNNYIQENILKVAAGLCTPMAAAFIYLLARIYLQENAFAKAMDKLLSSRVKLAAYALDHFGVTVFGQNLTGIQVQWDSYWKMNGFTFDCIYSYFISNLGLIWLVVICVLFILLAKRGDKKICMFIIMWMLYGVTEVHGLYCYMCFPILLIVKLIQHEENIGSEKIVTPEEELAELAHLRPYQRASISRHQRDNNRRSRERSRSQW